MNRIFKKKIDVSVLITSYSQRKITLETANYFSEICNEVILVDEEQPYLSEEDVIELKKKDINYISYKASSLEKEYNSPYGKRLIAAKNAKNKYVVHSNHDERYTYMGLLASVNELDNDKNLTFCAGQAIAIRGNGNDIHYTRQYENLCGYQNNDILEQRLYYHAKTYAPLAHYSVWQKESFINVMKKSISVHDSMPSDTIMEEVIFELAADLVGNSKATNELYWIRNRINDPKNTSYERGEKAFEIIENKLGILFKDYDNIKINIIINFFRDNFPFVKPSLIQKITILLKRMVRVIVKKRKAHDLDDLLNDNNINYESHDIANLLKSMNL